MIHLSVQLKLALKLVYFLGQLLVKLSDRNVLLDLVLELELEVLHFLAQIFYSLSF